MSRVVTRLDGEALRRPHFFSHSHLEMVFPGVLELLFLKVTAKSGFSTALLNANLPAPE